MMDPLDPLTFEIIFKGAKSFLRPLPKNTYFKIFVYNKTIGIFFFVSLPRQIIKNLQDLEDVILTLLSQIAEDYKGENLVEGYEIEYTTHARKRIIRAKTKTKVQRSNTAKKKRKKTIR